MPCTDEPQDQEGRIDPGRTRRGPAPGDDTDVAARGDDELVLVEVGVEQVITDEYVGNVALKRLQLVEPPGVQHLRLLFRDSLPPRSLPAITQRLQVQSPEGP